MGNVGIFSHWQPEYAARGLPTFPVIVTGDTKKPAVLGYMKVGMQASLRLGKQFLNANAFGVVCGAKTNLTVLDVDCGDERVLADALARHGRTPFVVRTGSGNFQAWYRHAGESRQIRPWGGELPIDQLGDGYVVAPPSEGRRCPYEIIEGKLDDVVRLPAMRNAWRQEGLEASQAVGEGGRNDALWRHCMRNARHCDTFDDLLDVAQSYNEDACIPPLSDEEVIKAAKSAWAYEQRGSNRFSRHGSWLTVGSVDRMASDPYTLALVAWLQAHNGPDARFLVADGLAKILDWPRRRLTKARKRAVEERWIVPLTKPRPDHAVEYEWGDAWKQA